MALSDADRVQLTAMAIAKHSVHYVKGTGGMSFYKVSDILDSQAGVFFVPEMSFWEVTYDG